MFRKMKDSPYFKAAMVLLVSGGILIVFYNLVMNTKISVGFETLNKTLAPVYIGGIFAFILCPVYNACVKAGYRKMLEGASKKGFSIGAMIIHDDGTSIVVDKEEKRRILTAARAFASLVCVIIVVGLVGLFIYFVVPQVVASGVNLVNTMPERLDFLSGWCSVHLSHFPMVATWVDNVANAGNTEILNWVQEHILSGNAVSIATMISTGVITAVKYVANAFIGLLILLHAYGYRHSHSLSRTVIRSILGGFLVAAGALLSISSLLGLIPFWALLVFIAGIVIVTVSTVFMTSYTTKSAALQGRILGFRNFIRVAEYDQLKRLSDENPQYFYRILPYAAVMGLQTRWARKFTDIPLQAPDWYRHDGDFSYSAWWALHMVNDCCVHSVPESRSGGSSSSGGGYSGGFSGGGFSGGGFGGGGGGGW